MDYIKEMSQSKSTPSGSSVVLIDSAARLLEAAASLVTAVTKVIDRQPCEACNSYERRQLSGHQMSDSYNCQQTKCENYRES
jgi:hypothetical protein